jgi:RNA polymerase sigma factor (TIGR02999 family)
MERRTDITQLLQEAADGREGALDDVMSVVYSDLERLARKHMRREFGSGFDALTLEPAALVNETFLKLIQQRKKFENSGQFFAIATRLMLRALVDYHRSRDAKKRAGGHVRVTLTGVAANASFEPTTTIPALVEALEKLEALDERKAEVVKLRVIWGFELAEIAEILKVSTPTVKRDWRFSRTWLAAALGESA